MYSFLSQNIKNNILYDSEQKCLESTDKKYVTFFNELNFISSDEYSIVVNSYDKIKKENVILKILNKEYDFLKDLLVEKLDHPNIIHFSDIYIDNFFIFIYMKKYKYDMTEYLLDLDKPPHEDQIIYFFKKMVSAVKYLHSNKIAHFDVKLDNFLIDYNEKEIILIDFGLAEEWEDKELPLVDLKKGSWNYAPPEMFFNKKYPITSPDIWSLGVCLYIMTTLEYPFSYENKKSAQQIFLNETYNYPKTLDISLNIKKYISKILIVDAFDRPNIFNIYNFLFKDVFSNTVGADTYT